MSTEEGWLAVPGVLTPEAARDLARRCHEMLAGGDLDPRVSDKRHGGTLRLGELEERLPEALEPFTHPKVLAAVGRFLPGAGAPTGVAYRCPQPGFGEQRLHTDAVPLLQPGDWQVVTAIVALCDFGTDNGATAVVPGSHSRPDQQRLAGRSTRHLGEVLLTGATGTAFVFCGHLLHRGTRNRSHEARPSLQGMWRHPDGGD